MSTSPRGGERELVQEHHDSDASVGNEPFGDADTRVSRIYGGTSEVRKTIIAKDLGR